MTQRIGAKGQVVIPVDCGSAPDWAPETTFRSSRSRTASSFGRPTVGNRCEDGSPAAAWRLGCSRTVNASDPNQWRRASDSWAVLAWLDGDEPAAAIVADALDAKRPAISWINLVEVHYRVARDHGEEEADRTLAEVRSQVAEELPGVSTMRAVASLKASTPSRWPIVSQLPSLRRTAPSYLPAIRRSSTWRTTCPVRWSTFAPRLRPPARIQLPPMAGVVLIAFLGGLAAGSFATAVAHRVPRGVSIAFCALAVPRLQGRRSPPATTCRRSAGCCCGAGRAAAAPRSRPATR